MFCIFDSGLSAFAILFCFFLSDYVVSGVVAAFTEFCGCADVVCVVPGLNDLCLQVLPVRGRW